MPKVNLIVVIVGPMPKFFLIVWLKVHFLLKKMLKWWSWRTAKIKRTWTLLSLLRGSLPQTLTLPLRLVPKDRCLRAPGNWPGMFLPPSLQEDILICLCLCLLPLF